MNDYSWRSLRLIVWLWILTWSRSHFRCKRVWTPYEQLNALEATDQSEDEEFKDYPNHSSVKGLHPASK